MKRARPLMQALLDADEAQTESNAITPSRDNVTTLRSRPDDQAPTTAPRVRDTYHASVYLPEEAAFALREIALMKRYRKPHTVMLEALAELFERYNKADLAAELRERMAKSDRGR